MGFRVWVLIFSGSWYLASGFRLQGTEPVEVQVSGSWVQGTETIEVLVSVCRALNTVHQALKAETSKLMTWL